MPVLVPDPPSVVAGVLDWITLAEAKAALDIPAATTTHDVELAGYVTAVSHRLDELFGAAVVRTITGEVHDGGQPEVTLSYRPVSAVTVVEYSSGVATTLTLETPTVRAATDYIIDAQWGVLRRRSSGSDYWFAYGRGNIVVDYTAGRYADTATVDPKFKLGAQIMLANLWRSEQGSGSVTFGAYDEAGATPGIPTFGLPNVVRDLLADELRPPVLA